MDQGSWGATEADNFFKAELRFVTVYCIAYRVQHEKG